MSYVIKFADGEYNDHGFAVKKHLAQQFKTKKAANTAAETLVDVDCIEEIVPERIVSLDDLISAIEKSTVVEKVLVPHIDRMNERVLHVTSEIAYIDAKQLINELKQL